VCIPATVDPHIGAIPGVSVSFQVLLPLALADLEVAPILKLPAQRADEAIEPANWRPMGPVRKWLMSNTLKLKNGGR